ncbi:MAG: V-type ATPase subunit [Polyangiales bacterium]
MARYLGDINTRARGLRTHLLQPQDFERLAHSGTLPALQRELSARGFTRSDAPSTPASLEREVRRRAAEQMAILARWASDGRDAVLAVVLEDEDRRSIQTVIRGAAQGAASDTRMSGLVPTMHLSERALRVLASQPTPADVVRMLVLWDHPFGPPLVSTVTEPHPSLLHVEVALQRAFAQRALGNAPRGGNQLVEYVQQVIDVMNAWSALLHFPERDPAMAELVFVEGGHWLSREAFQALFELEGQAAVQGRLGWELRASPLSEAFAAELQSVTELDAAVLRAQIAWQHRCMRLDPSSAAPIIAFALELRAEVLNLRRILWGIALRAPAALIQAELVL